MTSGGYSNSGAPGKDFQKLMFSKKEKRFDLVFHFFLAKSRCSLKKKKRFFPRIDLVFSTFRPDFIIISKKHLQRNETVCAIFERGVPKKGGPRQLPHSPHSISTTDYNFFQAFLPANYHI